MRNSWRRALLFLMTGTAVTVSIRPLIAEGPFVVDKSQVEKVQSGKTSVYCAVSAGRWIAGRYVPASSKFTPSSVVISRLKLKIKKAKKSERARYQGLLLKEQRYLRLGKPLCNQFNTATPIPSATPGPQPTSPVGPTATPIASLTPVVGPTKTPAPSSTPTVAAAVCIDQTKRTTIPGCFGIPTPNVGNIDRGATLHSSMNCNGCHGEKRGSTYALLNGSFRRVSDMQSLTPKNPQDTYDLVAYLNRFSK
jgi:hypothetical protein